MVLVLVLLMLLMVFHSEGSFTHLTPCNEGLYSR
jgi:hypothetical protein